MAVTYPDDLQVDLDKMEELKAGRIRTFSMEKRLYRGVVIRSMVEQGVHGCLLLTSRLAWKWFVPFALSHRLDVIFPRNRPKRPSSC